MEAHGDSPLLKSRRMATLTRRLIVACGVFELLKAAAGAAALAPSALVATELGGFVGLAYLAMMGSFLAFVHWSDLVGLALAPLGVQAPAGVAAARSMWGVTLLVVCCVPCAAPLLMLAQMFSLSSLTNPERLPPVVEEREQAGGFRDNAVVQVTTGSVAHPRIVLWGVASLASFLAPGLSASSLGRASTPDALAVIAGGLLGTAACAIAWQIVGAIDHNLVELYRRSGGER